MGLGVVIKSTLSFEIAKVCTFKCLKLNHSKVFLSL